MTVEFEPPQRETNPIREWRERNCLTRKEMATKLDIPWQTIRAWEIGRNGPGGKSKRKLAALIGMKTKDLHYALQEGELLYAEGDNDAES